MSVAKAHVDELSVFADRIQSIANVAGDFPRAAQLNPIRQFHDGGLESELVLISGVAV
jgi:hypothetical protein